MEFLNGTYAYSIKFIYDCKINTITCLSLLCDKMALHECPNWKQASENILGQNLPVKFATRGRLDLNDVTQEMFYSSKKIFENCHVLRDIFNNECSPKWPIFLCNFEHLPPLEDDVLQNGMEFFVFLCA